jgi:hypothetical protein
VELVGVLVGQVDLVLAAVETEGYGLGRLGSVEVVGNGDDGLLSHAVKGITGRVANV